MQPQTHLNEASRALAADIQAQFQAGLNILPDKPEENIANTLAALWHAAAGRPLSEINAESVPLQDLTAAQADDLKRMVAQRLEGVPLAHLTGRKQFLGVERLVDRGRYIPRKETELAARTVIDLLGDPLAGVARPVVLDLCTGIGTIALAVAQACPRAVAYGSDLLAESIANADRNAVHLGLRDRVHFLCGDMFKPPEAEDLLGKVDVVVSAPPYISSTKVRQLPAEIAGHEPEEAFNAGPFGLSIINELVARSPEFLRPGGYLVIEAGLGQAAYLKTRILKRTEYQGVAEISDENGDIRVVVARVR